MSYEVLDNEIKISARSASFVKIIGKSLWGIWLCLICFAPVFEHVNNQNIKNFLCLIIIIASGMILLSYVHFYHQGISIKNKSVQLTEKAEETKIDFKQMSMAKIIDDNSLFFYDKDNNICYTSDLEAFSREEIQLLINALAQKVVLKIEPKIAAEKGIALPPFAITKSVLSAEKENNKKKNKSKAADTIKRKIDL